MMSFAGHILLEAALRTLFLALALRAGMRLLRIANAPVQKAAWTMVLAAAIAMPLVMALQWHPAWAAVSVPRVSWPVSWLDSWPKWSRPAAPPQASPATAPSVAAQDASSELAPALARRESARAREEQTLAREENDLSPTPEISVASHDVSASAPIRAAQHAPSAPVRTIPHIRISRKSLVVLGWLAYLGVCTALVIRLLFGIASSLRLWRQAKPVQSLESPGPFSSIAVRASHRIASPANIGSGILLPADYVNWDEEKLRVVLAHERAHVRQRDFYLQLLAGFYAALTWFSPMGWWLKRKLSELGEAISDHAGLEAAASPASYAAMLLEFAARPRPAFAGVAMAHSTNLPQRIERLLNESSFRKAFAGGRLALAALLVPAVLIATAALVHVHAAAVTAQSNSPQSSADASISQQSATAPSSPSAGSASQPDAEPDSSQGSGQATQTAAPEPGPVPSPSPSATPAPVAAPAPPKSPAPAALPAPPHALIHADDAVHVHIDLNDSARVPIRVDPPVHVAAVSPRVIQIEPHLPLAAINPIQLGIPPIHIDIDDHGDWDGYAFVGDPGTEPVYSGGSRGKLHADVEKARAMTHGHFLLFRRDGKTYIIDDPAIVTQAEDMQKSVNDLRDQMRDLGKQMREAGAEVREEASKEREASATIPVPDLSKEMAELTAAVASLQGAQGGTITREQFNELQRKINEVQRRLISVQVKVDVHTNMEAMSKFSTEQGKIGEQMGRIGAEMGTKARENHEKIKSIFDESLKDGKARPVN